MNYKYVKFELPEKKMEVFVRLDLNGYILNNKGETEEVLAKVFNEYDLV